MTVSEFVETWINLNKSNLQFKYFYKNKHMYIHELLAIHTSLNSVSITITQQEIDSNNVHIYSTTYKDYLDQQLLNTLKADLPVGSFSYTLNFYLE